MADAAQPLHDFKKTRDFLVCIDSDGCAFDTMEIKHKECFCPNIIKHWGLQAVSKYAREAAEFVNLYSKFRGVNRWPALIKVFELLEERPEVQRRGIAIPKVPSLRKWMESTTKLGNPELKKAAEETGDPELAKALAWSEGVNATIEEMVHGVAPFPYIRESLDALMEKADMLVVSQTPCETLEREWNEHDLAKYVKVIAGQEMGTKSEHIKLANKGQFEPTSILMIGDAPGDRKAAVANDALFFPINPGGEEESWRRFSEESMGKFLDGTYAGEYAEKLNDEFEKCLPELPPWKR